MTTRDNVSQEKYDIDFLRLHLGVRWNTVLLPFEQRKFTSLLPDVGYVLDERVDQPLPFGAYPEASGTIARKGTTSLTMDTSTPVLALEAKTGQSLAEEFDIIEEALKHELSFDSPEHASFYEIVAQALVWTKKDALAVFASLGTAESIASRFSEKIGIGPSANVTLRLVPASGEVHSPDWWEFHIEPSFRSPQCYRVQIVYRDSERSKVIELAENLEQIINNFIALLEEFNA